MYATKGEKRNGSFQIDGFTLGELLIVVLIISVLISIVIPVFFNQLEKSREATDIANVRSAYAEVLTSAMTDNHTDVVKIVQLKQKKDDWQAYDQVNIGGITHTKTQGDTEQWKGKPIADGECEVSYQDGIGVILNWKNSSKTLINFNENIHEIVKQTGFLSKYQTSNFEIDSKSPNSTMVNTVKKELDENSLLHYGTWAYLADTHNTNNSCAYLFWTSVDTNSVGKGVRIPVIVSKDGGGFYVSDSITATRISKKDGSYIAISDHILNYSGFKQFTNGVNYGSFEQAYTAYSKYVHSNYPEFISTLPK